jgi:ATP-dependent RNA helicase DDX5/DBP2
MSGHYSSNREWKAPSWVSQPDKTVSFPASEDNLGQRLEQINWSSESLVKFNKDFYKEHSDVAARSDSEVRKLREDLGITIYGYNVPKPVTTFQESNFPDYIQKTLQDAKFVKPTPIQSQGT